MKLILFFLIAFVIPTVAAASDESGETSTLNVDPETAAKVFAIAYLVQGSLFRFFPVTQARWYGWGESDTVSYVMTCLGDVILFTGITAYCYLFRGDSACVSMGAMHLANIVSQGLVLGNSQFRQFRGYGFYFVWALSFLGAYAGLNETTWCPTLYKILAAFHTLVAFQMVLFPSSDAAAKMLDIPPESCRDDKFLALAKGMGHFYLGASVFDMMVLYGVDPATALGYASLPGVTHFIDSLFVSKTARKQTSATIHYVFWLVFFSVAIPLCLGYAQGSNPVVESMP